MQMRMSNPKIKVKYPQNNWRQILNNCIPTVWKSAVYTALNDIYPVNSKTVN